MPDFTECDYCFSTDIEYEGSNDYLCKECEGNYTRGLSDADCETSYRDMMQECNVTIGEDEIAEREGYNDHTEGLCRDGQISKDQYNTMDNPF